MSDYTPEHWAEYDATIKWFDDQDAYAKAREQHVRELVTGLEMRVGNDGSGVLRVIVDEAVAYDPDITVDRLVDVVQATADFWSAPMDEPT